MLTKLLAAVGLAGTLMLSLAAPAEAHGWDDGGFRRGPVYAHPGNRGHRMAIVGAYGTSLYVDFDYGMVIAVFASHAERQSPLLMASLRNVWEELVRPGRGDGGQR